MERACDRFCKILYTCAPLLLNTKEGLKMPICTKCHQRRKKQMFRYHSRHCVPQGKTSYENYLKCSSGSGKTKEKQLKQKQKADAQSKE